MEVEIAISKLMEAFRVPEIDRFQYAEAVSILQDFRRPIPRAEENITLPKKVIKEVLDQLYGVQDEGPIGEGWSSKELVELIHVLEKSIGVPKDNQYW